MMPKLSEDCTEIETCSPISLVANILSKILAEFSNALKEYFMIKWNLFWNVALGDL